MSFNIIAADNKWFNSTLKTIYPLSDGSFILVFKDTNENCLSKPQYHQVKAGQNGVTPLAIELMFSTALSAGTLGKKMSIVYDASSEYCYINRMKVAL